MSSPFLPPLEHCRYFYSVHGAYTPVSPRLGQCSVQPVCMDRRVFYLWNLAMARWIFLSAVFMVIYQLVILVPLFFYACFFPLLWSVWVLITLLSYFYVKNDFRKLWN